MNRNQVTQMKVFNYAHVTMMMTGWCWGTWWHRRFRWLKCRQGHRRTRWKQREWGPKGELSEVRSLTKPGGRRDKA